MLNLKRISKGIWPEIHGLAKKAHINIAGLDIGTSKTSLVIAQINYDALKILGQAETASIGVDGGCVTKPEAVTKIVAQVMGEAVKNAGGNKPSEVFVSFNGDQIAVKENPIKSCPVGYPVGHNINIAAHLNAVDDEIVLHHIYPRGFVGAVLDELSPDARVVAVPVQNIKNIYDAVAQCGLELAGVVYGPVAAAEVILTKAEKEFGTVLVDIGAGTTSVSVFDHGLLRETVVLPVGGEHLISDLAIGLHTSFNRAKRIFLDYQSEQTLETHIELVRAIIEARISEILHLTVDAIKNFNYPGLLPGGVVFCGGVTRLRGFIEYAENIMQMPVRIGYVQGHSNNTVELTFANAYGLLHIAKKSFCKSLVEPAVKFGTGTLIRRIGKWVQKRIR